MFPSTQKRVPTGPPSSARKRQTPPLANAFSLPEFPDFLSTLTHRGKKKKKNRKENSPLSASFFFQHARLIE